MNVAAARYGVNLMPQLWADDDALVRANRMSHRRRLIDHISAAGPGSGD